MSENSAWRAWTKIYTFTIIHRSSRMSFLFNAWWLLTGKTLEGFLDDERCERAVHGRCWCGQFYFDPNCCYFFFGWFRSKYPGSSWNGWKYAWNIPEFQFKFDYLDSCRYFRPMLTHGIGQLIWRSRSGNSWYGDPDLELRQVAWSFLLW